MVVIDKRLIRRPVEAALTAIYAIQVVLVHSNDDLSEISTKIDITGYLSALEAALGKQIPRALRLSDTNPAHAQLVRAAQYIAGMKTWVILPQWDTVDAMRRDLSIFTKSLMSGQYHYFPQSADALPSQSRLRIARRVFLSVLTAAIPAAGLVTLELVNVRIPSEIYSAWAIGSAAWAVAILATALDPDISEKITSAKTMLEMLRSGGRDKA